MVLRAYELDDLDATDIGHVEIEDDQIEAGDREALDRFEAGPRELERHRPQGAQAGRDHVAHELAIVDNEEALHW